MGGTSSQDKFEIHFISSEAPLYVSELGLVTPVGKVVWGEILISHYIT